MIIFCLSFSQIFFCRRLEYFENFKFRQSYNGMLRHSLGGAVIFIPLRHFILPYLTYCPAGKPEVQGIAIRAVSFGGKALVNKLWLLLYKRGELDLRLTKLEISGCKKNLNNLQNAKGLNYILSQIEKWGL